MGKAMLLNKTHLAECQDNPYYCWTMQSITLYNTIYSTIAQLTNEVASTRLSVLPMLRLPTACINIRTLGPRCLSCIWQTAYNWLQVLRAADVPGEVTCGCKLAKKHFFSTDSGFVCCNPPHRSKLNNRLSNAQPGFTSYIALWHDDWCGRLWKRRWWSRSGHSRPAQEHTGNAKLCWQQDHLKPALTS